MKLTSPTQQQGDYFETLALRHLQSHGLTLIAKNWHYKNIGEIDLIMLDKTEKIACLVFIEVRQRSLSTFGTAEDSITPAKQKKLIKTAQAFLNYFDDFEKFEFKHFHDFDSRFDVVTFATFHHNQQQETKIDWLKSAFWVE